VVVTYISGKVAVQSIVITQMLLPMITTIAVYFSNSRKYRQNRRCSMSYEEVTECCVFLGEVVGNVSVRLHHNRITLCSE